MGQHGNGNVKPLPGGGYRVRLSVGGKKESKVLRGVTKKEAETWAKKKVLELEERKRKRLPDAVPFSVLLTDFEEAKFPHLSANTQKTYRISMDAFKTYFGGQKRDPKVDEIRKRDVNGYLRWRRTHKPDGRTLEKDLSAWSLTKDRATLHALFTYAMNEEYIDVNPVTNADRPKGDAREFWTQTNTRPF